MRAMVYTAANSNAAELHHYGSVLQVVPARNCVTRPMASPFDRRAKSAGR